MKHSNRLFTFVGLSVLLVTQTALAGKDQEIIDICKAATPAAIAMEDIKGIKFIALRGSSRARTVSLRVYGSDNQRAMVECIINARTKQLRSIKRKS